MYFLFFLPDFGGFFFFFFFFFFFLVFGFVLFRVRDFLV